MPRVVLLLPTGTYRAPDFLAAARRVGVDVVVASDAAAPLDGTVALPFDDTAAAVDALVRLDSAGGVDAVVAADEAGVVVAAEAAAALGLSANPPDAARRTRDKSQLRAALSAAELPQPSWTVLPEDAGAADVAAAGARAGFPCVVKPPGLSASRGVLRVDSPADLATVVARVRAIAGGGDVLVETFVPGAEVAVEGLLDDGRLDVLAVFDKPDPLDGPTFPETLYVTPSRLDPASLEAVEAAVRRACTALGLVTGPVHAEVRVPPAGPPVVLEVASRTIGGLCARTLRFGLGMSLEELVLRQAAGLPVRSLRRERRAAGVLMLPVLRAGVLRGIAGREAALAVPGVEGVEITVVGGTRVEPLPDGDRYLGFVFARSTTPHEVESALREAWDCLEVDIR